MTEIRYAANCMMPTILEDTSKMDGIKSYSSGRGKRSFYELGMEMPCLFGGGSKTIADSKASIAPCSETKANTNPVSLSDRLTPLLISAGLVCGIIPMSMRDASGQLTLDVVLRKQDGDNAEKPKAV